MIEVDRLTRDMNGRRILDSVSFRAAPGEVVGFLGPNGAGKSTTLRILAGVLSPTSGRARVAGHDSPLEFREVRRRIGYLPEDVAGAGHASAAEHVAFVAGARGLDRRAARREAARRLHEVGLGAAAGREVEGLSRGERQRVGLAAALAGDPPVLLLDEPTSGLDPEQLVRIRTLIRRHGERGTVLFSTHLLGEAAATCDRVVVLHEGRVVAERTTGVTFAPEGEGVVEVQLRGGTEGLEEIAAGVPGTRILGRETNRGGEITLLVATPGDRRSELAAAFVAAGRELIGLKGREATLEETYLEIVAGHSTDPGREG